jgi:hypothetical protein
LKDVTGEFDPVTWEPIRQSGYRLGLGFDFGRDALSLRSEYYTGRCFGKGTGMGTLPIDESISPSDHEMSAFFVQAGYRIVKGGASVPWVQPYLRYQHWDRLSNSEHDYEFSYLTAGCTFGRPDSDGILRIDYETPVSTPESIMGIAVEEEAPRLLVRMQVSI